MVIGSNANETDVIAAFITSKQGNGDILKIFHIPKTAYFNCQPKIAYMDLETGAIKSLMKVFSSVSAKEFIYYFSQCLWKKVQKLV